MSPGDPDTCRTQLFPYPLQTGGRLLDAAVSAAGGLNKLPPEINQYLSWVKGHPLPCVHLYFFLYAAAAACCAASVANANSGKVLTTDSRLFFPGCCSDDLLLTTNSLQMMRGLSFPGCTSKDVVRLPKRTPAIIKTDYFINYYHQTNTLVFWTQRSK